MDSMDCKVRGKGGGGDAQSKKGLGEYVSGQQGATAAVRGKAALLPGPTKLYLDN